MREGPLVGRLSGPRSDAVRSQDAQVARLRAYRESTGPEYDELLRLFKNSPMTGMTTVLDLARQTTGFNPLAREDSQGRYYRFFYELALSNLFTVSNESASFELAPGQEAGSLVKNFVGDDPVLAPIVSDQLGLVLAEAHRNQGVAQRRHLVSELALAADGRYRYIFTGCSVTAAVMILPIYKVLIQASGSRSAVIWEFKSRDWPARAEEFLKRHLSTVDDWLKAYGGVHH